MMLVSEDGSSMKERDWLTLWCFGDGSSTSALVLRASPLLKEWKTKKPWRLVQLSTSR